jgi:hypothetical protein
MSPHTSVVVRSAILPIFLNSLRRIPVLWRFLANVNPQQANESVDIGPSGVFASGFDRGHTLLSMVSLNPAFI